jgi:hypothetical protein
MAFNFSPKIVTDGLIFHLDAANTRSYVSGSTAWDDLSRDDKTCTLINGPTFSVNNGGSILFDGVDDYARIGNGSPNFYKWFPITTQKFTLESWVKSIGSIANLGGIISLSYGLTLSISAIGVVYFRVYNNVTSTLINTISTGINLNDNTWHHIVATNDGTTSTIYVDGIFNNSGSSPFNGNTNPFWYSITDQCRIGEEVNVNNRLFKGNIGIVKVYNQSLSATQIRQNYNATKTRFGK